MSYYDYYKNTMNGKVITVNSLFYDYLIMQFRCFVSNCENIKSRAHLFLYSLKLSEKIKARF